MAGWSGFFFSNLKCTLRFSVLNKQKISRVGLKRPTGTFFSLIVLYIIVNEKERKVEKMRFSMRPNGRLIKMNTQNLSFEREEIKHC